MLHNRISRLGKLASLGAAGASLLLVMSGCSGGATGGSGSEGEGFEFGATQKELNATIADLEPVTLSYQPMATTSKSETGKAAIDFKEAVEERSNGQITIELVWGRAIAGYDEVDDALVDGRVDLSFTVPSYDPSVWPVHNAMSTGTTGFPTSPVVGNAVTAGALAETAFNEEVLAEFEEKGLVPLHPAFGTSTYYTWCTEPINEIEDWSGLQLRVGGQSHHKTMEALGATAVSMSATEVYDALQRNTVECEFGRAPSTVDYGVPEIAPEVGYSDGDASFADYVYGSLVAGSTYKQLPLAYKQIIFDSLSPAMEGVLDSTYQSLHHAVVTSEENGGGFTEYDEETQQEIKDINESFRDQAAESGLLADDFLTSMDDSIAKWETIVEDLGYEDGGDLSDFASWYEEDIDWTPVADKIYQEVLLEQRPK